MVAAHAEANMSDSMKHSPRPRKLPRKNPHRGSLPASFGYAIAGITETLRSQRNMQIHALAATIAVVLGLLVELETVEWIAVVIVMALVLSLELVNTAIEAIVDLASPEYHRLAKVAKDAAAGAVLVAAMGSVVVAGLIAWNHWHQ